MTRLDYLASRMEIHAYLGASLQQVRDAYTKTRKPNQTQEDGEPQQDEDDEEPVELRNYRVDLQPSSRYRGKGANQLGSKTFRTRLSKEKGDQFVIAVKNTNRWHALGEHQTYALAVVLERDHDHAPLYAELRARLEVITEIEVEVELET